MDSIGQRIRKTRQVLKISQQELADDLDLTKQAISNVETEKCSPSMSLLKKLLDKYNVNLNYIIGAKGPMFQADDTSTKIVRESILQEVTKMLDERGIL